jgi:hypothetical protein
MHRIDPTGFLFTHICFLGHFSIKTEEQFGKKKKKRDQKPQKKKQKLGNQGFASPKIDPFSSFI